jgi:hypothetical protein
VARWGDFSRFNNNPFDAGPLFLEGRGPKLRSSVANGNVQNAAYISYGREFYHEVID